jgi:hypothetical protein
MSEEANWALTLAFIAFRRTGPAMKSTRAFTFLIASDGFSGTPGFESAPEATMNPR